MEYGPPQNMASATKLTTGAAKNSEFRNFVKQPRTNAQQAAEKLSPNLLMLSLPRGVLLAIENCSKSFIP